MAVKPVFACASVLALVSVAGAQPVPPHAVYGEVSRDGVAAPGNDVTALHDGSELVSTKSGTDGQYRIEIPYDSSYSGEEISLEVNSTDTGSTVILEAGETSQRELDAGGLPHLVEGYIEGSTGDRVEDEKITFLNGDTEEASDSTDEDGFYSVEIPFSEDYSGETLDMSVDEESVDKGVEFESGGETVLNYTGEAADNPTQPDTDDGGSEVSQESSDEGTQESSEQDTQGSDRAQGAGSSVDNGTADSDGSPEPVADLSITGLETPDTVTQGSTFELEISVENSGGADGSTSKPVLIDGESASTFTAEVQQASSISTTREIAIEDPGNYTVSVADLSSEITVKPETAQSPRREENGDSGPPLALVLGGLSTMLFVSTIAYYIYSRGRVDQESGGEGGSTDFTSSSGAEPKGERGSLGSGGDSRTEQHDYDLSYTDDED